MTKILTIFIILILTAIKAMAGVIELKSAIKIDHSPILLGDIATFKDIDEKILERLKDLRIGSAPLPARKRSIDLRYIKARIETLTNKGESLVVLGPEKVEVTTSFQILDVDGVVATAKEYLLSKVRDLDGEFRIDIISPPNKLILPPGKVKLEVIEDKSPPLGQVYVKIRLMLNEKYLSELKVGFNIKRFQKVVVASRTISQHQLIKRDDLKEEILNTTKLLRESPFSELDSIVGKISKKPISEGTILLPHMVKTPPLVKRGSIVNLKSKTGNIEAMTLGKALQDGDKEERITVRNLSSKRLLEGVVQGNNLVLVDVIR